MKVSEVTPAFLAGYMRIDEPSDDDMTLITAAIAAAKQFIASYTGKSVAELEEYPDITIALMVLVQDMYDNRSMYAEGSRGFSPTPNKTVKSILGRYSVNLIA